MAHDTNICNFIGRLGDDPVARMANDNPVSNFTIAVGSKYGDKTTTEWIRCVVFGKLANVCNEYLKKGTQVFVSGRLQSRKWTDKEGVERVSTEIIVNTLQMLATGKNANQDADSPAPARQAMQTRVDHSDDDDSIPF
jgi:single-strand DNA-binding protein